MGIFGSVLVNQPTDHSGGVSRGTVNDRQQVTCDKKKLPFFYSKPNQPCLPLHMEGKILKFPL